MVTLSPGAGYTVKGSPATVNILDDSTSGGSGGQWVSITATDSSAAESPTGSDPGEFTVTRTGGTDLPLTVDYTLGGTATAGADYTGPTGSVTLLAGQSSMTILVNPIDDALGESTETAVATLASSLGYTVTGLPATVFISDNDSSGGAAGDLDIVDSNGAVVDEAQEDGAGGWVPVNNDNDNYNFEGGGLTHIYDMDDPGAVQGENDLVEIRVDGLWQGGQEGFFTLDWSSSKIAIYGSPDRAGGPKSTGMLLNVGGVQKLYVEGRALSATDGGEQIKVNFHANDGGVQLLDSILMRVYRVDGVMNVPGYAKYTYQATTPKSGPVTDYTPQVYAVTGGTLQGQISGGTAGAPISTSATILWDGGPVVGTYKVRPGAAVSNFFVTREVNVVLVELEGTPKVGDNSMSTFNFPVQSPNSKLVLMSRPPRMSAMIANLRVKRVVGPFDGVTQRGPKFIEVGMIQNLTVTKKHAIYAGFNAAKTRVSSLEGKSFLDRDLIGQPVFGAPFTSRSGYYAPGLDPGDPNAATTPKLTAKLWLADKPAGSATDFLSLTVDGVTKPATRFEVVYDFNLYTAVRTVDGGPDRPSDVYTIRAKAIPAAAPAPFSWEFEAVGTVAADGTWTIDNLAGNSGATQFTLVTDGSVVPITKGPVFNTAAQSQTWSTK